MRDCISAMRQRMAAVSAVIDVRDHLRQRAYTSAPSCVTMAADNRPQPPGRTELFL